MPVRVETHSKIRFLKGKQSSSIAVRPYPLAVVNFLPRSYSRTLDERGLSRDELRLVKQRILELKPTQLTKPPHIVGTDIGYVVPTKNSDPFDLSRVFTSIRDTDPTAPIVVIDDGSESPKVVSTVARRFGNVEVVRLEESHGPGFARNIGARHLTNEILVFLDSDVELDINGLNDLAALFELKEVIACAPRVLSAKMKRQHATSNTHFELDMGDSFSIVGPSQLPYLPSAALLVRKSTFDIVSGFDHSLIVGEDVDLTTRLSSHGLVIYYPTVQVFHKDQQGSLQNLKKSFRYGLSYEGLNAIYPQKFSLLPPGAKERAWFIWSNLLLGPTFASLLLTLTQAATVTWTLLRNNRDLKIDDAVPILLISFTQSAKEISELWLRNLVFPLTVLSTASKRLRRFLVALTIVRVIVSSRKPHETMGYRLTSDMGYSLGVATAILLELANYLSS